VQGRRRQKQFEGEQKFYSNITHLQGVEPLAFSKFHSIWRNSRLF